MSNELLKWAGRNITDDLIQIEIKSQENSLIIIIKDNAGGVPQDLIHKIFEPYFTTKFKSQGTGLGLYMSKVIIENNIQNRVGTINLYKSEDKGEYK